MKPVRGQWLIENAAPREGHGVRCKEFVRFDEHRFRQRENFIQHVFADSQPAGPEKRSQLKKLSRLFQVLQMGSVQTIRNIYEKAFPVFVHFIETMPDCTSFRM